MPDDLQIELPWRLRTQSYELVLTASDNHPALTLEDKAQEDSAWIDIWANWLSESVAVEIQHLNSATVHLEFESMEEAERAAEQLAWLLQLDDDRARMTSVGEWAFDKQKLEAVEWQPLSAYRDEAPEQETPVESDEQDSAEREVQNRLNELEAAVRQELENTPAEPEERSNDSSSHSHAEVDTEPLRTEAIGSSKPTDAAVETEREAVQDEDSSPSGEKTANAQDEDRTAIDESGTRQPNQAEHAATLPAQPDLPERSGISEVVVHIHCSAEAAGETQSLLQKTGQRVEELPAEGGYRFLTDPVDRQIARSLLVLLSSRYGVTADWAEADG